MLLYRRDLYRNMHLKQACEEAWEGEEFIIYCGKGIGYYQEQEYGAPPRFILNTKEVLNNKFSFDN